jgi:hypothetical protein
MSSLKERAMPNFANCDVISDGDVLVDAAGDPDHDFSISLDSNVRLGIRSGLFYVVDPGSTGVASKMLLMYKSTSAL